MDALNLFHEWDARTDDSTPITVTAEDIDAAPLLFQTPKRAEVIDCTDPAFWLSDDDVIERVIRWGYVQAVRSW